jgi:hypothetical protein
MHEEAIPHISRPFHTEAKKTVLLSLQNAGICELHLLRTLFSDRASDDALQCKIPSPCNLSEAVFASMKKKLNKQC